MTLRIGLLMHSLNPRGGVVHTLELADALVARGHDVTVFAAASPGQRLFRACEARLSIATLGPLPAELVPMVGARMDAMADHLRHLPDLRGFDVLHSQDSITANALATLQAERTIGGFVRTVHHLDVFDHLLLKAWQRRGVQAADTLFCVSKMWQDVLARDWGLHAHLVGNGVNLRRFTTARDAAQAQSDQVWLQQIGVQTQGPVWLAVGGIEARKNTTRLLQAFAQARQQCPQAQLVIAGGASLLDHDAETQAFQSVRNANGMADGQPHADRLLLTGPLPEGALPALYRRATALAMPSLREGFGLVVLEALACGTPAIASRRPPFTEHLGEHDVLWTDPLDVADIARALLASLQTQHTAPILARARHVCERLSWQRSAASHESLYLQHLACHA